MARPVQFEFESVSPEALAEASTGAAPVPRGSGVFRVFDPNDRLILLEKTARLAARLAPSYRKPPPEGVLDLRAIGRRVEFCRTDSPFEALYLLYLERRRWFPDTYRRMQTFPLYSLLAVDPRERFPRLDLAREIAPGIRYFGPFRTLKEAERLRGALERALRIRPCEYAIRGDDPYPDCLYFQMQTCSRPCNGDIDREAYLVDIEAAGAVMTGAGESGLAPLRRRMESLAEATRFEEAEQVRLQIERARSLEADKRPPLFEVGRFDYLVLLRGRSRRTLKTAMIRAGRIEGLEVHDTTALEQSLADSLARPVTAEADTARTYDEFCLSAEFLRRSLQAVRFVPIGPDPDETARRANRELHSGSDASSEDGADSDSSPNTSS